MRAVLFIVMLTCVYPICCWFIPNEIRHFHRHRRHHRQHHRIRVREGRHHNILNNMLDDWAVSNRIHDGYPNTMSDRIPARLPNELISQSRHNVHHLGSADLENGIANYLVSSPSIKKQPNSVSFLLRTVSTRKQATTTAPSLIEKLRNSLKQKDIHSSWNTPRHIVRTPMNETEKVLLLSLKKEGKIQVARGEEYVDAFIVESIRPLITKYVDESIRSQFLVELYGLINDLKYKGYKIYSPKNSTQTQISDE